MSDIPPVPLKEKDLKTWVWQEWFRQVRDRVNTSLTSVTWGSIDFTGSTLDDILTKNHNQLTSIQGGTSGEYYHLTSAQASGLTGGTGTTLHTHAHNNATSIQGGTSGEYYHLTSGEYAGTTQSNIDASKLLGNTWAIPEAIGSTTPAAGTFTNLTSTGNTTLGDSSGDTLTIYPSAVTWSSNPTHTGNHTFSGNVSVSGTTTIGDSSGDGFTINPATITWSNNPTHTGNHTFSGNISVNGTTTIGDSSGDGFIINPSSVTWNSNPTHSGNHTYSGNIVVNGNTTIGDSSGDGFTINPANVTWSNNPTHTGNHTFSGNIVVNGNTTLGDSTSDITKIAGNLVLPKTSGYGIKVDTSTETFGWRDLLGAIQTRPSAGGGASAVPDYVAYRGNIYGWRFGTTAPNNHNHEAFIEFHMPHDYVPGSDLYIHTHWSQTTVDTGGTAGVPGVAKWYFDISYADGHGTAGGAADPFISPITVSVTQQGSTTQYGHMIAEVQFTNNGGTGGLIDSNTISVDGLILVRVYRDPTDVADTLNQDTFLHFVDVHYQSTNIATKNKAPNFYS
jgi:hypothetical protein